MTPSTSLMSREAAEAGNLVASMLSQNRALFKSIGRAIASFEPSYVMTNARGSSDHSGVFAKYLIMQKLGTVVASGAPSISSVFGGELNTKGALCLSISQSGRSPDIVNAAREFRTCGGMVIAIVNDTSSPLAQSADYVIPLHMGAEKSVAATKSYISSIATIIALVAEWSGSDTLRQAMDEFPSHLNQAYGLDWSPILEIMQRRSDLYCIGRGIGLSTAREAALKFKETCQIHAESFSAAECSHGPIALSGPEFPGLLFAQNDSSRQSVMRLAKDMVDLKAPVLLAGGHLDGAIELPVLDAEPILQPALMIQSFYRIAPQLAHLRGQDPDNPPSLRKVTETH